jgi:hypothetical protein
VGINAARLLARRIEQQRQWERADAVRAGEQPETDPDADELIGMEEDLRLYARRAGQPTRKRLVDGRWQEEDVVGY